MISKKHEEPRTISKDQVYEILRDQNYWFKDIELNYIPRNSYLKQLKKLITSKSIIAVKGARRSGKTVLLKLLIKELINAEKKEQILYVNLEDYRLYPYYSLDLLEKILETYKENINPDKKTFFFIDEIQNIKGFEHFLRTLYDKDEDIKLIITGSNSRLLSKELGTLLTGRISTITVFPFSFEEFLEFNNLKLDKKAYYDLEAKKALLKKYFKKYLKFGAIPEFLKDQDPFFRLKEYLDNVLFKDIVERFNVRNVKLIKELSLYLITNSSRIFSINQISRMFKVSINTIQEYLFNLNMAYLFFYLDKFSFSAKERVTTQSKVYCIDTGLTNATGFKFSENYGRLLENIVFLELIRDNNEVYYYSTPKSECDFVIKDNLKVTKAIQVTKNLEETKQREINGLIETLKEFKLQKGLIITEDEFEDIVHEGFKISIRPIWAWLLNKEE